MRKKQTKQTIYKFLLYVCNKERERDTLIPGTSDDLVQPLSNANTDGTLCSILFVFREDEFARDDGGHEDLWGILVPPARVLSQHLALGRDGHGDYKRDTVLAYQSDAGCLSNDGACAILGVF